MSIIEKALDKLDERDAKRGKDERDPTLAPENDVAAEEAALARDVAPALPDDLIEREEAELDSLPEDPRPSTVDDTGKAADVDAAAPVESAATGPDGPRVEAAPTPPDPAGGDRESTEGTHTAQEVEIDFARLQAQGFITPNAGTTGLAEQIRLLKRPLLMNATVSGPHAMRNGNLMLITSSLPSEGKTFISLNLAFSIAMELDRTVLLIDADPARSDVSKILGFEAGRGLTDYLADPSLQLSDLLVRTNMSKLTVLPSGPRKVNVTELLASEQMRHFADELSTRYRDRVVIFDSPPLLATTGSSVLAHHVGQIALVVEAIRTPQKAILESLRMLEPQENVAIVLNKSRERIGSGYDYGYYGYGYGYGYGDRDKK